MYRKTYVEVNLNSLKNNIKKIINETNKYEYHFGVVKADCYGCGVLNCLDTIIESGCNYLAVATLEEALEIRSINKEIPILCLGEVEDVDVAVENNITITITSLEYLKNIKLNKDLKVHIKINTGMNRLGISSKEEFIEAYNYLKNKVDIEGIYTHIYEPSDKNKYNKQIEKFKEFIKDINLSDIKIIHTSASEAMLKYEKLDFVNGCRLGISMYGFYCEDLNLESVFSLHSKIIQINDINENDIVGYNGTYKAKENEKIGVVAIGYADGIIRKSTGMYVYINNKVYEIVGNICMDMLFVKIDDTVKLYDKVTILKDNKHIMEVCKHLNTIPYEIMCMVGKRVPRIYIK